MVDLTCRKCGGYHTICPLDQKESPAPQEPATETEHELDDDPEMGGLLMRE